MAADIFSFWSDVPGSATHHPADGFVWENAEHNFQRDCLPAPFTGRLKTAPIVLLLVSPGYDDKDSEHARSPIGQEYYARSRTGDHPLPTEDEHAGYRNWLSRSSVLTQFGIDYDQARNSVAILNIGAYHSKGMDDAHMLAALPSSRTALDWAQSILFPQALAGQRIVICLRAHKYWGLRRGGTYEGLLYSPPCIRDGRMIDADGWTFRTQLVTQVQEAAQRAWR